MPEPEKVRTCCCPCHRLIPEERRKTFAAHPQIDAVPLAQIALTPIPGGQPHDYCFQCAAVALIALVQLIRPQQELAATRAAIEALIRSTRGEAGGQ